jgi:inhibitor of cysteine peptidase
MKKIILIVFLVSILSFPALAQTETFSDVYSTHINNDAITYLKDADVLQGYSDGTFKPENRINRAEFIKIIVAVKTKNPTGSYCFTDVKNEWYAKYICTAKNLGYVTGYSDGTFKPGDYINFAEASKIITKAFGVKEDTAGTNNEWFAGYVKGLENKNAIPSTIQFFDKEITRGDMSEIIWRLKANKTDKVSETYSEITSTFPNISSCSALKEKFTEYQSGQAQPYLYRNFTDGMMIQESVDVKTAEAPTAGAAAIGEGEGEGEAAADFSETNVQVSGVDEADIIKNDGEYVYMIKNQTVRILKAYPPSNMKETAKIEIDDQSFWPQEMYVDGDKLVIIGQANNYYYNGGILRTLLMPPYPYRSDQTKVYIFDISDRSNPTQARVVRLDGYYTTSRRINNDLFMVLNANPSVWVYDSATKGEDLIPQIQDNDNDPEPMAGCADIRYFPGFYIPNYLVVASIPLDDDKGSIDREVFLGSSENVFSSRTNLYVANTAYDYNRYTDWNWNWDEAKTHVYKFALDNGKVDFKARGEVPGTILNQFSMDAYKENFRIATTKGNTWDDTNPSTNNVYILDTDMKTVGSLEGLAPGEKIYSTRFLGDRLYMVTYKQVDPLFAIDLKDPENPKVLGSLKIPGFSEYLHPYDENHIIGFGKETVENDKGVVTMEGMKMGMFDVTDVTKPVQKFVEVIGDRGTYSELLNNHKALLFDKDKELLAFPIQIMEKIEPESMDCNKFRYSTCPSYCYSRCIPTTCTEDSEGRATCTNDCEGLGSCYNPDYEQYTTTFSGAVVYNVNLTDGFKQRGKITHYNEADMLKMGNYWPYDYDKQIQRIIYIGDYLYTISQGMLKSSTMDTVKEVKSLTID